MLCVCSLLVRHHSLLLCRPTACSCVVLLRCCCPCCHVQVAELHRQLAPHMLRRLKKDVLKQLPPKMEQMVRHSFRGFVFDFGFGWDLVL